MVVLQHSRCVNRGALVLLGHGGMQTVMPCCSMMALIWQA